MLLSWPASYLDGPFVISRVTVAAEDVAAEVGAAFERWLRGAVAASVAVHRAAALGVDLVDGHQETEQGQGQVHLHLPLDRNQF